MTINFKPNEQVVKAGDTIHCFEQHKIEGKLTKCLGKIYLTRKS